MIKTSRKFITLLLIMLTTVSLLSCNTVMLVSNDDSFPSLKTSCENAFIYDISSEKITLFSSGSSETVAPASTTKLLTALVALEILDPLSEISPGDEVYLPQKNSSSAFIRPHHTLTLEMLIEAMIIPSGNDAAYAVAAACGRKLSNDPSLDYTKAVERFVREMNEYAKLIGCTSSNFTTPDGFAGKEHYSTAADMAIISKKAFESDLIMKYASMQRDDVVYASGHTNVWINTNLMLDSESKFYNENVIGLKTGSLDNSYSLITVYDDGMNKFIIGVFGAKSDSSRYTDTNTLIDSILTKKELE